MLFRSAGVLVCLRVGWLVCEIVRPCVVAIPSSVYGAVEAATAAAIGEAEAVDRYHHGGWRL